MMFWFAVAWSLIVGVWVADVTRNLLPGLIVAFGLIMVAVLIRKMAQGGKPT